MSLVFDLAAEDSGKVVYRTALFTELLKPLDKEKMHTNKQLIRIEDQETGSICFISQTVQCLRQTP